LSRIPSSRVRAPYGALALVLLLAALLAGCGGGSTTPTASSAASTAAEGAFPVTVKAANGPLTLQARPERIVSLSATGTEMLFAIGAGSQVAAVDDQSNYPAEAPKSDLSAYKPNLEAIAAKDPDLVVASDDINGLVAGLTRLKIPVLLAPAAKSLDDSYAQIEQLGAATGRVGDAAGVVARMRKDIQDLTQEGARRPGLTYYHELDPNLYSATSRTFIGSVYGLLGLANVADKAQGAAGDYPQLSAEYVLSADPDMIFLADTKCCQQNAATVGKRPGWSKITAVRTGNVVALDDDVASRWGPRVVDFLRVVSQRVAAATPAPSPSG
jgi:iron complex transport system substrate-binding protein